MSVIVGLRFSGLGEDQVSPNAVFSVDGRFVEATVDAVTGCTDVQALAYRADLVGSKRIERFKQARSRSTRAATTNDACWSRRARP